MSEYEAENYLQMSGIQHFGFCKRQWGLIHIAGIWERNERTVRGDIIHQRVDSGTCGQQKDWHIERSVPVASSRLGLSGVCDVVEFKEGGGEVEVCPVEYKSGEPKSNPCDRWQLCAQSMALEEMLHCRIAQACLYYYKIRRRNMIEINEDLRSETEAAAREMHRFFDANKVPAGH